MTTFFAHTDDVRLPSPAAASRFSNRAAHDIPFLEFDFEHYQPASLSHQSLSLDQMARFASAHVVESSG